MSGSRWHPNAARFLKKEENPFYRSVVEEVLSELSWIHGEDNEWDLIPKLVGGRRYFDLSDISGGTGKILFPFITTQYHDSRFKKRVVDGVISPNGEWYIPKQINEWILGYGPGKVLVVLYYGERAMQRGLDPTLAGVRRDENPHHNDPAKYRRCDLFASLIRRKKGRGKNRRPWPIQQRVWYQEVYTHLGPTKHRKTGRVQSTLRDFVQGLIGF